MTEKWPTKLPSKMKEVRTIERIQSDIVSGFWMELDVRLFEENASDNCQIKEFRCLLAEDQMKRRPHWPLPGWIVESNRADRYIDSYHFSVPGSKRAVELLSGKECITSQMVETKANKPYRLTFSLGHAGDSCKQPLAIMAFASDQAQNIHYAPDSNSTFHLNFSAKAQRTRVAFYIVYYNTRTDDKSSLYVVQ
ncbi:uncharacterized protein LOC111397114 [Olea europaea subsp. europaea]|uniref:Uncharacterized protein LOC111397114 n=1 Tax=Olea europaea subsp. europaea TaxID=158383 RepID=A0A8S0RWU6_OLEEU|nr:uncharacterized protein LOC111397114 [Olea europaea subsp. europaea]